MLTAPAQLSMRALLLGSTWDGWRWKLKVRKTGWILQWKHGIYHIYLVTSCSLVFFKSNDEKLVIFAMKTWISPGSLGRCLTHQNWNIALYTLHDNGSEYTATKPCDQVKRSNGSSKTMVCIPKANHEPDIAVVVISDVCLSLYTLELSLGCWRRCAQTGLKHVK